LSKNIYLEELANNKKANQRKAIAWAEMKNDLSSGTSESQIKCKYSIAGKYIWNSIRIIYIWMRWKENQVHSSIMYTYIIMLAVIDYFHL
jgi:hypothetical protein